MDLGLHLFRLTGIKKPKAYAEGTQMRPQGVGILVQLLGTSMMTAQSFLLQGLKIIFVILIFVKCSKYPLTVLRPVVTLRTIHFKILKLCTVPTQYLRMFVRASISPKSTSRLVLITECYGVFGDT